jgi:hypothetical protein
MIEWPTIPSTTTKRSPCGSAKVTMVCYELTPPTRRKAIEIMASTGESINDNNSERTENNGEQVAAGTVMLERGSDTPPAQISPMPFSSKQEDDDDDHKTSPVGVYAFFEPPQSKCQQHAAVRSEPTSVLVQQKQQCEKKNRSNHPVVSAAMVRRVSMDCRPAPAAVAPAATAAVTAARHQRKTAFRKFKRRPVHQHHHHHPPTRQCALPPPPPPHVLLEAWRRLAMTMDRSEASRLQIQRYNSNNHHGHYHGQQQALLFNKTRHKLMSVAHRELVEQQQRVASSWNSSSSHHHYHAALLYRKQNNMPGQWHY